MARLIFRCALVLLFAAVHPGSSAQQVFRCPPGGLDCAPTIQTALDYAGDVLILPPDDDDDDDNDGDKTCRVGSPTRATKLVANTSNQVVTLAPGLELRGFLNATFYPSTGSTPSRGYSPALVTLDIAAENFTLLGSGATLREITAVASGTNTRVENVSIVDPGWDGLYVRGAVGLTLKGVNFDRPYRNGISVIDAVDMLAEDCVFSNSLPNGTGRVSPMAGVDLEPNRYTDRLSNITFRRCKALNNSGAGFQVFLAGLNGSSMPVSARFEDCFVGGVGFKPYGTVVSCGYYFNAFGGNGAAGSISVVGGSVRGTASFGAAVYAHGANDPLVSFDGVSFQNVAVRPGAFEPKLGFSNGPLAIAALGSTMNGHSLGGVSFKNVVVKDDLERPVLVVVGGSKGSVGDVAGDITLERPPAVTTAGGGTNCTSMIAAGAEGWTAEKTQAVEAALCRNVSITRRIKDVDEDEDEESEEKEKGEGLLQGAPTTSTTTTMHFYRNASNINSLQSRAVTTSGQDGDFLVSLGRASSLEACGQLCAAWRPSPARAAAWAALVAEGGALRCRSFTRYTASFSPNTSLASSCFGHLDPVWLPLSVVGVDSGWIEAPCETDLDCSLNGRCLEAPKQQQQQKQQQLNKDETDTAPARCVCGQGWTGTRCETLDLLPVDPSISLGFDPATSSGRNLSSWGGSIQQVNGTWHMWAVLLANGCGISSYLLNSEVVHAISEGGVEGPYRQQEEGQDEAGTLGISGRSGSSVVLPPFAHEPVVVRAPGHDGELVMASVTGDLGAYAPCTACSNGSTGPSCISCNNSCFRQTPTLSVAQGPDGPWASRPLYAGARGENPSIWIMRNGTLLGMGRGGMAGTAKDWRNSSTWKTGVPGTLVTSRPDAEDPMLWQDEDDHFHALLHNLEGAHMCGNAGPPDCLVGIHIFSRDGVVWLNGGLAYTNAVEMLLPAKRRQGPAAVTRTRTLRLNRRERPHLVFAEGTRRPVALSNSAQVGGQFGDRSFTLVQKLRSLPETRKEAQKNGSVATGGAALY